VVRVIIEHRCKPGKEAELWSLLGELRGKVINQSGHVSSETLRSLDDPSYWMVISTWTDVKRWKAWEVSRERKETINKIKQVLVTPEKVSVFSFMLI
jgi:heme-degrading monooxygenase HmoA